MTRVPGRSYVVGGAVRDRLLGLPVSDRDHVVVGTTADAMRAAGFTPVGRDFPVFLHPETHEEYALARTERKVAAGYGGFVFHADPSVTLADDLARRDLTVNAMAEDDRTGALIDPLGGRRDLEARVFRHVGPAFVEDPVRVLRLARFAARFSDFTVAPETVTLARAMALAGEIDALVPERVWQELSRGLMERHPVRLFDVLRDTHALVRLLPEIEAIDNAGRQAMVEALDRAVDGDAPLDVRFAVAVQGLAADAIDAVCKRLAVPRAVRDTAVLVAAEGPGLQAMLADPSRPDTAMRVVAALERGDAFRRRARFGHVVAGIAASIPDGAERTRFADRVARALAAVDSVDAAGIAKSTSQPPQIPILLRAARAAAIDELWKDDAPPADTDGR